MPIEKSNQSWQLDNSYAQLPEAFYSLQEPVPVENPQLVCFNRSLANDLGLGFLTGNEASIANYFSGNKIPAGSKPLAQAYAGHQFGHFTMLGDGRAILLGEQITPSGRKLDIQLKGSGQTPFSRRGDGRATLYSMLREYLISEAMHHLSIPTTRSLAVVSTGEQVYRDTLHNGAILTRIAESHLRVGTFEYARNFRPLEDLQELVAYSIERHYPEKKESENPALELLKSVMQRQVELVVNWMRVGFVHGVMNTDNMSIAGETIDYGPCAFMNAYSPKTVFSSIDAHGRYAFGNQSKIAAWNLTAFANALLPAISENTEQAVKLAQDVIDSFQFKFAEKWYAMMFGKLGIPKSEEKDRSLVDNLLSLMEGHDADYTQVFSALQEQKNLEEPLFQSKEFNAWKKDWQKALDGKILNEQSLMLMEKSNPKIIPRNHWVEDALDTAVEGNMAPFEKLMTMLSKPYASHPEELQFERVPKGFDAEYRTFCGT